MHLEVQSTHPDFINNSIYGWSAHRHYENKTLNVFLSRNSLHLRCFVSNNKGVVKCRYVFKWNRNTNKTIIAFLFAHTIKL